jgi:hypothetical protein
VAADPVERVDLAIERLDQALRSAGFDSLAPVADREAVAEIDAAVAPYAVPVDLRRAWERVDLQSLQVTGWSTPEWCSPRTALAIHRQNLAEAPLLFGPPLLFPIARISGDQWSVELLSDTSPGGTILSQDSGAAAWCVEYASFTDLLEVYAELIADGSFQRWDNGLASFSRECERTKQDARLRSARDIPAAPTGWPPHWLAAAGLVRRD